MSTSLLKPSEVASGIKNHLVLDVRNPEEFSSAHIPSSILLPLPQLTPDAVRRMLHLGQRCILVCHAGTRATNAAGILSSAGIENLAVMEGGMEAWKLAGLPVNTGEEGLSIQSQTRVISGGMVLSGLILGHYFNPGWYFLSGFVGVGLIFAGMTGWCGMSLLLAKLPWNRDKSCLCSN